MNNYKLQAPYEPNGDQPEAIKKLVKGVNNGKQFQTLLGATGTGKTFTIANVIQQTGRPALVLAHNKTLAAQLCNELREFFPKNAVEYFISYYDYYQPEAYVPVSDTYIAKTASINEEREMLKEVGYCTGVENYARHLSGREEGSPPECLIDYFPKDWLLVVDESHVTCPQLHAMYNGDQSRKKVLIDHGFRLPSAADNRPLKCEEFWEKSKQTLFISATPVSYTHLTLPTNACV